MPTEKRIKPIIKARKPSSVTLESLKTDMHPPSFKRYQTIINKLNKHYGWEEGILHIDKLNQKKEELVPVMIELWNINNRAQLMQRFGAISSLITRALGTKEHEFRYFFKDADRKIDFSAPAVTLKNVPKWEDVQKEMEKLRETNSVTGKVALIFSHGYALRVGEIFDTRVGESDTDDDNERNFLNLKTGEWTIRRQKNGRHKKFTINEELRQELEKRTSGKQWLLSKNTDAPYSRSTQRLPYHGWTSYTNNMIRKSFVTHIMKKYKDDPLERQHWHDIMGHSTSVAHNFYTSDE